MSLYSNIFYIDDDEDDQMFFTDAINEIGNFIKCTLANDGRDAIDKLSTFLNLPDLIFVDINMPRMNGIDFIKYIKAEQSYNNIPVVVLSTANSQEATVQELGANAFISKPTSYSQLRLKLESILNQKL